MDIAGTLGNFTGLFNLATLYKNIGDIDNAIKYYNICADNGNIEAMCCLAKLHKHNDSIRYWLLAISHGSVYAMLNLAKHYYSYDDKTNMKKYLNARIDAGCSKCLYYYAVYNKNDKMYVEYLIKASKLNNREAVKRLIKNYKFGDKKLLKLLDDLAKNDIIIAIEYLASYYLKICDHVNIKKYMNILVEKGNIKYIIAYGDYYKHENDTINMVKYYELAANKGSIIAITLLFKYYDKINDHDCAQKYAKMLTL